MSLFVSKIQRFSISDGDGIRTTVFLSGCNLRCAWCHNPETQEMKQQVLHFSHGNSEVCGKEMTVDEVFEVILRDLDFYKESNGGVTISGGEPLLQENEVAKLLKKCKDAGIHTIVDTAACVSYEAFQAVLPYTDLFFYDVKAGTEEAYEKYIGGSLQTVLSNLERLIADDANVTVRIPLIGTVNADRQNRDRIIEACRNAGVKKIDLLPYHKYGISKYAALGREYTASHLKTLPQALIEHNAEEYCKAGFSVHVER